MDITVKAPQYPDEPNKIPVSLTLSRPMISGEKLILKNCDGEKAFEATTSGNQTLNFLSVKIKCKRAGEIKVYLIDKSGRTLSQKRQMINAASQDNLHSATSFNKRDIKVRKKISNGAAKVLFKGIKNSPDRYMDSVSLVTSKGTLDLKTTYWISDYPFFVFKQIPDNSKVVYTLTE